MGMRTGDLAHMISDLISIDEYESKITVEDAIVVAFYCKEYDAAADLNRFIQRSNVDVLETEISHSPTQEGFYVVFVELNRTSDFPDTVIRLLDHLEPLVEIKEFRMKVYRDPNTYPVTREGLATRWQLPFNPLD